MNQAQAEERFRNVKNVFDKLLRDIEKKEGQKIISNGDIRFKSPFESEKDRWKIEENLGCST